MKQELVAYLIRDNERVSDMPTDEILVALDQLMQASIKEEQSRSSDNAAVYKFLHAVKLAMRASKDVCQVKAL
jgi:hypothetical protein